MTRIEVHPHQVRAWGHAAQHCGHGVASAKHHVKVAEDDVGYANASGLGSVGATTELCTHWETQLGRMGTDVTGTADKLVSTANLVSRYDVVSADPFVRLPFASRVRMNP